MARVSLAALNFGTALCHRAHEFSIQQSDWFAISWRELGDSRRRPSLASRQSSWTSEGHPLLIMHVVDIDNSNHFLLNYRLTSSTPPRPLSHLRTRSKSELYASVATSSSASTRTVVHCSSTEPGASSSTVFRSKAQSQLPSSAQMEPSWLWEWAGWSKCGEHQAWKSK